VQDPTRTPAPFATKPPGLATLTNIPPFPSHQLLRKSFSFWRKETEQSSGERRGRPLWINLPTALWQRRWLGREAAEPN